MEMKQKYRNTEIGFIPEDWVLKPLSELGSWKGGGTPSMRNSAFWSNGTIPWVSSSDIKSMLISDTPMRITESAVKQSSTTLIPPNSIMIVARSGILRKYLPVAKNTRAMAINQDIKALIPNDNVLPDYLLHLLVSNGSRILATCLKSGTTVESIEFPWLKAFRVPFPRVKAEQRAIANALNDLDDLICALGRLVAKRCDIKRAVMQELLTGTRHLPGFMEEWKTKKLSEVLKIHHGKSQHEIVAVDGKYPILGTSGEIGRTNSFLYGKPSALIGRKGTIDSPQYTETPFWTIDTLFYTEIYPTCIPKFIYYVFCTINWTSYNEASGVPSLSASTIKNIEFKCPAREEQEAIASILSDIDFGITGLGAKINKLEMLKQGMMQGLLTGRMRLT